MFTVSIYYCSDSSSNKGSIILITDHEYDQELHTQIKITRKGDTLPM